jgi:hypothetical protein
MSFAERVQRKRTEQEQERVQQWQSTLSAADAPALVAMMDSYETALRELSADLLGSLEFRALFGESPSITVPVQATASEPSAKASKDCRTAGLLECRRPGRLHVLRGHGI